MATKSTTPTKGKDLAATVKNIHPLAAEISELDQHLKSKGQQYPNQFTMQALYKLITNDDPFSHADRYQEFIDDLRQLFLDPDVSEKFYGISLFTGIGLHQFLRDLERFFMSMQRPEMVAELDRTGLVDFPKRYLEDKSWGGVEEVMKPYRSIK